MRLIQFQVENVLGQTETQPRKPSQTENLTNLDLISPNGLGKRKLF